MGVLRGRLQRGSRDFGAIEPGPHVLASQSLGGGGVHRWCFLTTILSTIEHRARWFAGVRCRSAYRLTCGKEPRRTAADRCPTSGGLVGIWSTGSSVPSAPPGDVLDVGPPGHRRRGKSRLSAGGGRNGVQAPSAIPSRSASNQRTAGL